tara:strand:- start:10329 stop:11057 length:729 start_codon:yes stop_codon:yes gene_type:complete
MNLVIDIGNTAVKFFLFEKDELIETKILDEKIFIESIKLIDINKIDNIICSSVTKSYREQLSEIFKNSSFHDLSNQYLKLPFQNNYKSKTTLGQDRIGLIASAVYKYPKQNSLVIDIGTCITYDFVDSQNIYHGGAISQGILMRYKSFKVHTANLPLLEFQNIEKIIGSDTNESIHIGVCNGIIGEIKEYIKNIENSYPIFNLIITGGDSMFLLNKIKNAIFADQDFLAQGLNYIIKFNEVE